MKDVSDLSCIVLTSNYLHRHETILCFFFQSDSSDEECKQLNSVRKKSPNFLSIFDLKQKETYHIGKFERVETSKGERIRVLIYHSSLKFRAGIPAPF